MLEVLFGVLWDGASFGVELPLVGVERDIGLGFRGIGANFKSSWFEQYVVCTTSTNNLLNDYQGQGHCCWS